MWKNTFIHTKKPLTYRAYLKELPILRTWEKIKRQLASVLALVEARIWPNGERDSSSLVRVLITTSESPSRIKEEHPSSRAREMARAAARASTTFEEKGRGICSDREAMTWLWLFRILNLLCLYLWTMPHQN